MSIKITATSTCDLPPQLLERYQIDMVPLYVSFGGGTYRDGVDAAPEDIFRHVEGGGQLPTTSAVNIADYQALFAGLSPKYDSVLHITIGSEFSCCYQNVLVAAEDFDNVYVVDSRNLTVGQGILALKAAEAAERKSQVGSGDRSERIRTYNFPQGRVTDHRIGLTLYKIDAVMDGDLDGIIDALITADQAEKLKGGGD